MSLPQDNITNFTDKHHVMTLSTAIDSEPYCANLFYVYSRDVNRFIFTSDINTRHAKEASLNPFVAGSIVLETKAVGKIEGLQFQGVMSRPDTNDRDKVRKAYLKKFPFAVFMDIDIWIIDVTFMKYTDNKLGFGKKLLWEKEGFDKSKYNGSKI